MFWFLNLFYLWVWILINFDIFGNSINNEGLYCMFMIKIIFLMISILIFNVIFKLLEDNVLVEVIVNYNLII